ncbi:MAG: PEP-CTERM sorting domain-containing protein [Armatimonadota bacterium]
MRVWARSAWVGLYLMAAVSACADYHFYSVANDDFRDDNDTLWAALEPYPEWTSSYCTLRDSWDVMDESRTDGRDTLYDDLLWYASNLQSGDVFMFSYFGHGGWDYPDTYWVDEGSTARPRANDPDPDNDPPYDYDEWIPPPSGGNSYLLDDQFADALADFDPGVQVIVISAACHAGGWVGGSHDLNSSAPATNSGLYAVLGTPEQGLGIGVKSVGDTYYETLLATALANTVSPYMLMSDWYEAAVDWGETASYLMKRPWDSSAHDYYYWPAADWVPSEHESTWYDYANDTLDHWGWEETYLQLRPIAYSVLDGIHNKYLATPEPTTAGLLMLGLAGLAIRRRRPARP